MNAGSLASYESIRILMNIYRSNTLVAIIRKNAIIAAGKVFTTEMSMNKLYVTYFIEEFKTLRK